MPMDEYTVGNWLTSVLNPMKLHTIYFTLVAALVTGVPLATAAAPKKLLVVSVTTGFTHSSIPPTEELILQLAKESGLFTVDFIHQPPGKPKAPAKPKALAPDATAEEKAAFAAAETKYKAELPVYQQAQATWLEEVKKALEKLSPESLKSYDGVIFNSTTGELPIPDKAGFLEWIKSGKAFIGIHAATDVFHKWPEYLEMIGGEFKTHGPQLSVSCINADPQHPATKHLGKTFAIQLEEIYQFIGYDPKRVHELLVLDKKPDVKDPSPGHYPVAWCREYGKGRVFYTALGHREDIVSADPSLKDRKNSVETSKAFQTHVLGGIQWALGLEPGDAAPQAK